MAKSGSQPTTYRHRSPTIFVDGDTSQGQPLPKNEQTQTVWSSADGNDPLIDTIHHKAHAAHVARRDVLHKAGK